MLLLCNSGGPPSVSRCGLPYILLNEIGSNGLKLAQVMVSEDKTVEAVSVDSWKKAPSVGGTESTFGNLQLAISEICVCVLGVSFPGLRVTLQLATFNFLPCPHFPSLHPTLHPSPSSLVVCLSLFLVIALCRPHQSPYHALPFFPLPALPAPHCTSKSCRRPSPFTHSQLLLSILLLLIMFSHWR